MAKGFPRPVGAYLLKGMDLRWFPFLRWAVVVSKNGLIPTQGIVFEATQGQAIWFVCPNGRIHRQHFPQGVSRLDYRLATAEEQVEVAQGFKIHVGQIDQVVGWQNVVAFVSVLR